MSFLSLFGGDDSTAPPPAQDFGPLIGLLKDQGKYGADQMRQQFDFFKQIYNENKGDISASAAKFREMQGKFGQAADEDLQDYRTKFRPAQDRYIAEVQKRSTPEYQARERARAQAEAAMQAESAITRTQQQLASYGVNPGALRNQGVMAALQAQKGASMAAAGEAAGDTADRNALALNRDVVGMGGEVAKRAAGNAGVALQQGTGAANIQNQFTGTAAATMGTGTQWGSLANQAYGGAGNLQMAQDKSNLEHWKAQNEYENQDDGLGSALGGLAGAGLGWYLGGPMGGMAGAKIGSSLFSEEGGPVPALVPQEAEVFDGPDGVPARLEPGEFVVPKDVVAWYGEEKLQSLIRKAREGKQGATAKPETRSALQHPPTYISPGTGATRTALPRSA